MVARALKYFRRKSSKNPPMFCVAVFVLQLSESRCVLFLLLLFPNWRNTPQLVTRTNVCCCCWCVAVRTTGHTVGTSPSSSSRPWPREARETVCGPPCTWSPHIRATRATQTITWPRRYSGDTCIMSSSLPCVTSQTGQRLTSRRALEWLSSRE